MEEKEKKKQTGDMAVKYCTVCMYGHTPAGGKKWRAGACHPST
jgi:hypothetical protein